MTIQKSSDSKAATINQVVRGGVAMTHLANHIIDAFPGLDNERLLSHWETVERQESRLRYIRGHIESELIARMKADEATAILHESLTCELKIPSPTYDLGKLNRLAELVPPEILATAYTPAHEETVTVPAKWNATKFKPWAKYGAEVAQVIADATIPGPPRLVIKRKDNKAQTGL